MHLGRAVVRTVLAASVAAVVAASWSAARADFEAQVGNGDKVTGTFLPANEVETYLCDVPAGAKFSVSAKGKKKKGSGTPTVSLALLDSGESPLGVTPARVKFGAKASFTAEFTDRYRIVATGDGATGDYTFVAKWKLASKKSETLEMFGAGDEQQVVFSADAGSVVTVTAARVGKSKALPRVLFVGSEDGGWESDFFDPPASDAAPAHTVRGIVLGGVSGEYAVSIGDDSEEGGNVKVSVTIAKPRGKPRVLDLTTRRTGDDPANQFGKGAVVGPEGNEDDPLGVDPEGDSPIAGAAISIPPGALSGPVVISMTTAPPIVPPGGMEPQGPGVDFGPNGLQFKQSGNGDVLVTIPFDPDEFGGDYSGLQVYVRDAQGNVTLVDPSLYFPDGIDEVAGTVTFPVSHFSTYQVFGPARPRPFDLNADGFDDLVVPASTANGERGRVHVLLGRRDIVRQPPTGFDVSIDGATGEQAFGRAIAVGDVNGDGVADLAVASLDPLGSGAAVRVWFGGTGFAPTAANASAVLTASASAGASFGACLAIGDVTGDGKSDLVAGAPGAESTQGSTGEGAVFVFAGGSGFASGTADDADVRLDGGARDLGFGISLALGNVVGDSAPDLVVGSSNGILGFGTGSATVIAGGSSLQSGSVLQANLEFTGDFDGDQFGASVAVGDVNGDGAGDIVVGAPGADAGTAVATIVQDSGEVFVFYGPDFVGGAAALSDEELNPEPQQGEACGTSVAVGQFYGNSARDVVYGAPLRDGPSATPADRGRASLVRGGTEFPPGTQALDGTAAGEQFGALVLRRADLNRDGRMDVAVGAPGASSGAGAVTIFFNGLFGPTVRLTGGAGEGLGQ